MSIALKLTRRGEFTVHQTEHDATQCGIRGTRRLFYRVEVTCTSEALDENGFLVDQLEIHNYMTENHRKLSVFPSCERLAVQCCDDIRRMCRGVMQVEVTIGASAEAFMTATWRL